MVVLARREDGSPRCVELTEAEMAVYDDFDAALDKGLDIPSAAFEALRMARTRVGVGANRAVLSDAFIAWLSDSTVEWPDRRVVPGLTAYGRSLR